MAVQTKTGLTAEDIKGDALYGIVGKATNESKPYADTEIEKKLRAAEDFYESNLHVKLGKCKFISGARARGITPNPNAAIPEFEEPGYDYERDMYVQDRWGYMHLRQRPIIPADTLSGLINFYFVFPSTSQPLFTVPHEWLRVDFKYGELNILPSTGAIVASFGAWFLGIATGGAVGLPKVIYVDYFAGLDRDSLAGQHADLLEGIKLRSLLLLGGIMGNVRAGGTSNTSLSMDGLSHSRGFGGKFGPYSGQIELALKTEEEIRESWRRHNKGVPAFIL